MHHLSVLPFFALLVGAFLVVAALIQIGILRYAYLRIGISSRAAMALLLGSLIGSYINIPIVELPERDVQSGVEASHDHRHHRIRRDRHRLRTDAMAGTVIAVNVGGAVIPALLSQGNRVKAMPADSFVAPKTTAGFDTYASEAVSLFCRRGNTPVSLTSPTGRDFCDFRGV